MADAISMTNEEKRLITAQPMTAAGNPAVIDGSVAFSIVSGTCTLASVDDTSAYVVSGDTAGDSTVSMVCDADLGSGVINVSDTMLVHVTSASAANLVVTVGNPELK
jgi:hypothetical protein